MSGLADSNPSYRQDAYYQDEWVTVYHGDSRTVLPQLIDDGIEVAAVVTDPPYGIGIAYADYDDSIEAWFKLMADVVPLLRRLAPFVVMPSGAIKRLGWWYETQPPDWLIAWYKGSPGHAAHVGFNDWEPHLVWGKPPAQIHDYFQTPCGFDGVGHPCPKPVEWATWLVLRNHRVPVTPRGPAAGRRVTVTGLSKWCTRCGKRLQVRRVGEK